MIIYIDTSEFNKLAADVFNAILSQATLITKTDFDAKLSTLNRKITQKQIVENESKKLKIFDLSYFIGRRYFEEDGTPNYLVFQPLSKYFKADPSTDRVYGNLKVYLLKVLNNLQDLIINSTQY